MKKKVLTIVRTIVLTMAILTLTACGDNKATGNGNTNSAKNQSDSSNKSSKTEQSISTDGKVLIAYFTLADNYEKPEDMDATSQASINIENKELIGNTEYLAGAIQEETGGRFVLGCREKSIS